MIFVSLQKQLDPNQIFVNQFVIDKLGLCNRKHQCCCTNYTCLIDEKCDYNYNDQDIMIYVYIFGPPL